MNTEIACRDVFSVLSMIRSGLNLKQGHVARQAGIAQSYLSMIEHGKKTNVPLDTLTRIADALGCDVHIVFRERQPAPEPTDAEE